MHKQFTRPGSIAKNRREPIVFIKRGQCLSAHDQGPVSIGIQHFKSHRTGVGACHVKHEVIGDGGIIRHIIVAHGKIDRFSVFQTNHVVRHRGLRDLNRIIHITL